jgi:signal transduction histidine kinase/DNA-binding response OmpR family regulator
MFCYSFRKDLYKTVHIDIGSYDNNTRLLKLNDRQLLMLCNNADVVVIDRKSLKYQKITVKKSTGLKNIITTCAIGDGHGVWIGTKNDGLLHLDMKDRILETIDMPIPEKDVMNLAYAGKDELCITTNSNVYLYNTKTLTCVTYKGYPDSRETINDNGLVSYGQGVMAVGTHNGCRLLKLGGKNARQSDIAINKLEITTNINNKIAPSKDIKNNEGVTLPYNDNDLHISFGECNYHHSIKPILSYKMDGYDDDWRHTVKYNFATYPNLPAGHYTFRVKSTLKNANGNYDECRLNITILPPVWLSWQALVLYFIAMMYIIYYINKLYLRNKSNELEINAKANEAERERRTNEMNIRFFANVSHEFRNPLTLIAGPVISLYRDEALPANAHNSLKIVSLSVNRMLQLIDQMLDFNKLENDVLKLQVSLEDVSELLRVNTEIFREAAACHSISVALSGIDNPRLMWVDKDKLIKIMDNLLTNALKHTDDGGEIKIDCSTSAGKHLVVTVTNNGKQIPEEKLPLVFKRYYQVKELNSNHEYGFGTGIGLYYVRQLVRLHHGEISVNNVVGGGVAFSFHLPLLDVYNEKEKLKDEMKRESHQGFIHIDRDEYGKCEEDNTEIFGDRRKMLVIDDDTNLSLYIRSIFKDSFSVKNLYSAEAAMEYLKDHQPDIIISDIVMDEMSGLELCRQLKQDIVYSHIPIILVSGKSNIREQIEGLKVGAIAYIVKPFDPDMLRALVESQMNNLDEVKKRLAESTNLTNVSDKLSPQDRAFMSELYALMEQQIAMEEMNISSVCEEMHVSRTKFNYKVKALTGMTPSNFFRIYKLNCAAKLLRDGKYNVSEAAMRTGFNNMPYFSTVFKKQFGVSPSEYK